MLIFADQFAELQRFESLPFPPCERFQTFLVSMVGQVSIFHWSSSVWRCQLAAACRGGSCSRGCHGYLPALAWSAQASCQHSRHQFPSLSIGDEFNILLINVKFMVPYKSVLSTLNGRGGINNYFLTRVSEVILVNFCRLLLYLTQICYYLIPVLL